MKTLRGRVAVVTGAASGIGLAMAERFAAEGMNTRIMHAARNRPESLADAGKPAPAAEAFSQALADRLAGGYPPAEVADQVVQGIPDGRFYIVPAQPEVKSRAAVRARDILELRNPTLPGA